MTIRRITANLPAELLERAQEITGKGITETLVEGLERIRRQRAYERILALEGKVKLDINIDELRGRGSRRR